MLHLFCVTYFSYNFYQEIGKHQNFLPKFHVIMPKYRTETEQLETEQFNYNLNPNEVIAINVKKTLFFSPLSLAMKILAENLLYIPPPLFIVLTFSWETFCLHKHCLPQIPTAQLKDKVENSQMKPFMKSGSLIEGFIR